MGLAFVVTSLIIVITPGTGALYTIAAGLNRGARAGIVAALAGTLATLPHLLAAITGLAAVLYASGVAFAVLKYAGVAYLLFLAWSTWRDTGALSVDARATGGSVLRILATGVTLNLLNPKLTLFFFAFLPQFVPAGDAGVPAMLGLSAVFMAMTFVVFVVYGVGAAAVRDHVLRRPRVLGVLRKTFAATFVALGARLAVQTR
ncbi:LysE family translocator [Nocardia carnea]|uniref:LysE family translocator n=1 Tax=Nocardia carnea TaxID=37328 RepID=UPI0024539E1F|nr:LysE family translocator [Nocardia carnea]